MLDTIFLTVFFVDRSWQCIIIYHILIQLLEIQINLHDLKQTDKYTT